jgi:hypothetical protein
MQITLRLSKIFLAYLFEVSLFSLYLGLTLEPAISSIPNSTPKLAQLNDQTLPPSINLNSHPQPPLVTVPPLNSRNVSQPNDSTPEKTTLPNQSDNMDSIIIPGKIAPKLPDIPVIEFGKPLPH